MVRSYFLKRRGPKRANARQECYVDVILADNVQTNTELYECDEESITLDRVMMDLEWRDTATSAGATTYLSKWGIQLVRDGDSALSLQTLMSSTKTDMDLRMIAWGAFSSYVADLDNIQSANPE
ncbi:MAG: hypothetical protein H7836_17830, partial [Magnetococcus sp. YQC-3]